MTITGPDARSAAPGQAVVDAAPLVLERMGLSPADLLTAPAARPAVPTFAEYIPVVSALVSDGCRRAYGSYWNRVTDQWGSRRIDEPTPSEIRVGFQNPATGVGLGFYAARSYSLRRPPRMGRRWIRSWERSATGWSGRGGRSWRLRWGRRPL